MSEELVLDLGPEWRSFSPEDRLKKSRVGAAITPRLHDWGITSWIMGRDERSRKLAALQAKLRSRDNRNIVKTLQQLNRICQSYQLPNHVCDEAALVARKLARLYDVKGVSVPVTRLEQIAAAAVLYAAARSGIDLGEEVAGHPRKQLLHILWLRGMPYVRDMKTTVSRIASYIADRLGINHVLPDALKIYHIYRGRASGLSPKSIAAAIMYVAAKINDVNVSQLSIASVVGVTDATVRNATKKMKISVVYEYYREGRLVLREVWFTGKTHYGLMTPSEWAAHTGIIKKRVEKYIGDPIRVVFRS